VRDELLRADFIEQFAAGRFNDNCSARRAVTVPWKEWSKSSGA
jgi:hypothetical protein